MKINSFSLVLHFFNIRNFMKLQKPQEVGWLRGNPPKNLFINKNILFKIIHLNLDITNKSVGPFLFTILNNSLYYM